MPEPKTRQDYLDTADQALQKAGRLADYAESSAHHPDSWRKTADLAAAGALYADIARSAAAIAAALPETPED